MNGQFDFLIIGGDEASLAAAAAAVKAGARVALSRPVERKKRSPAASPTIPNFVWRRLELQDYDLTVEPVSARITLFADAPPMTTLRGVRETADTLAADGINDHLLWRDFAADMTGLADDGFITEAVAKGKKANGKSLAAMLGDPVALDKAARFHGSSRAMLEDYFEEGRLKTHVAAHALSVSGLGDTETGSASALAELLDPDAWRYRTPKDGPSLRAVLECVCQDAGVDFAPPKVISAVVQNAKVAVVEFSGEEKIKASHILFATPDAALAAGAAKGHGDGARGGLGNAGRAQFRVRFRLAEGAEPPAGDRKAIFQIIDHAADLQDARDAAIQGRLFDRLPVEFEFAPNGELLARSTYLPAAFHEDGEWRGWTGQDRQAVSSIIKERLSSRMPGFASLIRRMETEVVAPPYGASPFDGCDRVMIQPRRHDAISAAVKLIDEVMARGE
ncbi:MAG: hypothetical protein AAFW68_01120 [Pseudomonadota bacterium]